MGDWSLGSVTATVYDLVDDIPPTISGTRMLEMADRQRTYVEQYTGLTVGSVGIPLKFQNALFYLTAADVITAMTITGADGKFSLGDFSYDQGQGSNSEATAKKFREEGMREVKQLGRNIQYAKAFG